MKPAQSSATRTIQAPIERVYAAFLTPEDLAAWLPPGGMTGVIHAFDGRVGGGFEMSLFYPQAATDVRGKTAEREDRSRVRFLELEPNARIVEAVTFVSDDPAFSGEMRISVTFTEQGGGTSVTMAFDDLPPGVRPEDNDEGARLSLENLARRLEAERA